MHALRSCTILCVAFALGVSLALAQEAEDEGTELSEGIWRLWLETPGGELPFLVRIARTPEGPRAWIHNGEERIAVPEVTLEGGLTLGFPHYDSKVVTRFDTKAKTLSGSWTKTRGKSSSSTLSVRGSYLGDGSMPYARFGMPLPPAGPSTTSFSGRWRVTFESEKDLAVGIFAVDEGRATGTFLTTLGDYRYLEGDANAAVLRLSCFDGAHAFLFHARPQANGSLAGDFWSSGHWHETWIAVADADAQLADPWKLTSWQEIDLAKLEFPDLSGRMRSLDDPDFRGKARVLEIFGSWCPNCHDLADTLASLERRYRARGLKVLGLAFELTGDFARDTKQVASYVARHRVEFPILVAGTADKAQATERLPLVDRVRSYPTTIFLDARGRVRGVYQGFSGPATGRAHQKLVEQFERLLEKILAE